MEQELQQIKAKLRKTETKEKSAPLTNKDLTEEENQTIKDDFFNSGAQNWYSLIKEFTFETCFLPLDKKEALAIISAHTQYLSNKSIEIDFSLIPLLSSINDLLSKEKWEKFFIKLSTRSPKDSPLILEKAIKSFKEINNLSQLKFHQKITLFAEEVQKNFCAENAKEGLSLLITSERVFEDLTFALEDDNKNNYEAQNLHLVIRKWSLSIPILNEFRGFVWNSNLNAIGQYYHSLYFPELAQKKYQIGKKLKNFFDSKIKPKLPKTLTNCMIDFAFVEEEGMEEIRALPLPTQKEEEEKKSDNLSEKADIKQSQRCLKENCNLGKIMIIEINPFDGKALGAFPGSTGLFDLEKDEKIIKEGGLEVEVRVREEEMKEFELRYKLNDSWKSVLKSFI